MGLLDQVISAAATSLGGGQQAGANPMVSAVLQLLNSPQVGGIEGLVKAFQSNGLGDVARSWVSTGQNMPASAEQVQSAVGGGQIGQLASNLSRAVIRNDHLMPARRPGLTASLCRLAATMRLELAPHTEPVSGGAKVIA